MKASPRSGEKELAQRDPLQVGTVNDLEKSLHATASPARTPAGSSATWVISHLSRYSFGVRRLGCAALELCYVAAPASTLTGSRGINRLGYCRGRADSSRKRRVVTTPGGDPHYFKLLLPTCLRAGDPCANG